MVALGTWYMYLVYTGTCSVDRGRSPTLDWPRLASLRLFSPRAHQWQSFKILISSSSICLLFFKDTARGTFAKDIPRSPINTTMAFDRPIEADRIDDFNLFSAFVRAPLWLLGSVLGGNASANGSDDDDDHLITSRLDDGLNENSPPGSAENSPSRKRIVSDDDLASSCQVSRSGVGDCADEAIALSSGGGFNAFINGPPGLKRSKNLSWSDESGMSLVEYNDEVSYEQDEYGE